MELPIKQLHYTIWQLLRLRNHLVLPHNETDMKTMAGFQFSLQTRKANQGAAQETEVNTIQTNSSNNNLTTTRNGFQETIPPSSRPVRKRSGPKTVRPYNCSSSASTEHMNATFALQETLNQPINTSPDLQVLHETRNKLVALVKSTEEKSVPLTKLLGMYCKAHNELLNPKSVGYPDILELVHSTWPSLKLVSKDAKNNYDSKESLDNESSNEDIPIQNSENLANEKNEADSNEKTTNEMCNKDTESLENELKAQKQNEAEESVVQTKDTTNINNNTTNSTTTNNNTTNNNTKNNTSNGNNNNKATATTTSTTANTTTTTNNNNNNTSKAPINGSSDCLIMVEYSCDLKSMNSHLLLQLLVQLLKDAEHYKETGISLPTLPKLWQEKYPELSDLRVFQSASDARDFIKYLENIPEIELVYQDKDIRIRLSDDKGLADPQLYIPTSLRRNSTQQSSTTDTMLKTADILNAAPLSGLFSIPDIISRINYCNSDPSNISPALFENHAAYLAELGMDQMGSNAHFLQANGEADYNQQSISYSKKLHQAMLAGCNLSAKMQNGDPKNLWKSLAPLNFQNAADSGKNEDSSLTGGYSGAASSSASLKTLLRSSEVQNMLMRCLQASKANTQQLHLQEMIETLLMLSRQSNQQSNSAQAVVNNNNNDAQEWNLAYKLQNKNNNNNIINGNNANAKYGNGFSNGFTNESILNSQNVSANSVQKLQTTNTPTIKTVLDQYMARINGKHPLSEANNNNNNNNSNNNSNNNNNNNNNYMKPSKNTGSQNDKVQQLLKQRDLNASALKETIKANQNSEFNAVEELKSFLLKKYSQREIGTLANKVVDSQISGNSFSENGENFQMHSNSGKFLHTSMQALASSASIPNEDSLDSSMFKKNSLNLNSNAAFSQIQRNQATSANNLTRQNVQNVQNSRFPGYTYNAELTNSTLEHFTPSEPDTCTPVQMTNNDTQLNPMFTNRQQFNSNIESKNYLFHTIYELVYRYCIEQRERWNRGDDIIEIAVQLTTRYQQAQQISENNERNENERSENENQNAKKCSQEPNEDVSHKLNQLDENMNAKYENAKSGGQDGVQSLRMQSTTSSSSMGTNADIKASSRLFGTQPSVEDVKKTLMQLLSMKMLPKIRHVYQLNNLGLPVRRLKKLWTLKIGDSLSVHMQNLGMRKLLILLTKIPNIVVVGDGPNARVITSQYLSSIPQLEKTIHEKDAKNHFIDSNNKESQLLNISIPNSNGGKQVAVNGNSIQRETQLYIEKPSPRGNINGSIINQRSSALAENTKNQMGNQSNGSKYPPRRSNELESNMKDLYIAGSNGFSNKTLAMNQNRSLPIPSHYQNDVEHSTDEVSAFPDVKPEDRKINIETFMQQLTNHYLAKPKSNKTQSGNNSAIIHDQPTPPKPYTENIDQAQGKAEMTMADVERRARTLIQAIDLLRKGPSNNSGERETHIKQQNKMSANMAANNNNNTKQTSYGSYASHSDKPSSYTLSDILKMIEHTTSLKTNTA